MSLRKWPEVQAMLRDVTACVEAKGSPTQGNETPRSARPSTSSRLAFSREVPGCGDAPRARTLRRRLRQQAGRRRRRRLGELPLPADALLRVTRTDLLGALGIARVGTTAVIRAESSCSTAPSRAGATRRGFSSTSPLRSAGSSVRMLRTSHRAHPAGLAGAAS